MLFQQLRSRWFSRLTIGSPRRPIRNGTILKLEQLEGREVPTVTFNPITNYQFPAGQDLFVPLTSTDAGGHPISYSATSTSPQVTASVLTGGETVDFNVSGTDKNGNAFTGDIVLRLFDNIAPNATARIVDLVNTGFYNGKNFHRVIDGFMAQGGSVNGDGTGSTGLGNFDDEFNSAVTFDSPGLLAFANAGNDTNDSQFFIVDTPLSLSQLPQSLNFRYTIAGLLVSGFDIYSDIIGTQVEAQSASNPEVSKPVKPITINTATIINDTSNGVLVVSAPTGFAGSSSITVTASDVDGSTQQSFNVQAVQSTVNNRPFLGTIPNVTTTVGTAVTFSMPATDLENDQLTYVVRNPNNFNSAPPNVTVSIDQADGRVTVTPASGFTGVVSLLVGVRDQIDRSGTGILDNPSNFNTQVITLTVSGDIQMNPAGNVGLYGDDNFTGNDTPNFTVHAPTGDTVTVSVNGSGSFATKETAHGVYTVTLPANVLKVGSNTISATDTPPGGNATALTPLTITYAPSLQSAYVVPGAPGSAQHLTFTLEDSQSNLKSEIGYFVVDDLNGDVNGIAPGSAGYAKAAISRAQVIMSTIQLANGTSKTVSVQGGQILSFYLIQGGTSAEFLSNNPGNSENLTPVAFFSFTSVNPDKIQHVVAVGDQTTGVATYAWEDQLGGGDRDYNDRVFTVQPGTNSARVPGGLTVPAGPGRDVSINFQLQNAIQSVVHASAAKTTTAPGEIGYYVVDNANGDIGGLHPGDSGYAQAALNAGHLLFTLGAAALSQKTATLPGGTIIGFYMVQGDTAANFLSKNPTNSTSGSGPNAFFSFSSANPDGGDEHFRNTSPEQVGTSVLTTDTSFSVHGMGTLNGTMNDFDSFLFTVNFTTSPNAGDGG
jgi:cyclophilin family peptidyl-prolyl cis-trans isomerase